MPTRSLRLVLHVAALAWPINFAWEMAQAYLYAPMGTVREATRQCLFASFWDVVIVLGITAATSLAFGGTAWLVERRLTAFATAALVGAVLAAVIESRALNLERWTYGSEMPVIPALNVGLVPVIQMVVLPPVTFLLARTSLSRRGTRAGTRHGW